MAKDTRKPNEIEINTSKEYGYLLNTNNFTIYYELKNGSKVMIAPNGVLNSIDLSLIDLQTLPLGLSFSKL